MYCKDLKILFACQHFQKKLGVASALAEDGRTSGSVPEKPGNSPPRFVYDDTSRNPLYSLFSVALKP